MFEIKGKVAVITGGAAGIGLECAKELLRNGLKGVALLDINNEAGIRACKELELSFGENKAVYIKTDVTNITQFENAFKETAKIFKNVDILINSAGIMNDAIWEREIAINLNGTINGILLALEKYLPSFKTEEEGVIVNISSVAGLAIFPNHPIYMSTKYAVHALGRGFGCPEHYQQTKVKVLTLCPGATDTALQDNLENATLGPRYTELTKKLQAKHRPQKPQDVAKAAVKIIKEGKSGSVWVANEGKEAYEVVIPSLVEI